MTKTAAVLLALLAASPAVAADLGRGAPAPLPSEAGIPACDDPAVLDRIVTRQHWAEENTWKNGVRIESISDIRQRYGRVQFVSSIRHRHCEARAALTAARADRLYYVISEDQGFASYTWGVDFCMPRHDPYRVYDADCRVLR